MMIIMIMILMAMIMMLMVMMRMLSNCSGNIKELKHENERDDDDTFGVYFCSKKHEQSVMFSQNAFTVDNNL